ncbi:inositol monophosphatase family protein [Sulfitobacter sp. MF3-043]|uniref:inositol monophosphatase family protein n=1 Tax=Sulfitobacter sediminivivens TaxID=3252902 RepID=UPI0036DCDC88
MTLTSRQIDDLINVVRETGQCEIMPNFRNLAPDSVQIKANIKDLVTDADRAAERAIATATAKILPQAVFVGEETVADRPELLDAMAAANTSVIVDPIDGTANFAAGLAVFGTILAVVENGETTFGLLYDPVLDDWIYAIRGQGAHFMRDGKPPRKVAPRPERSLDMAKGFLPLDNYAAQDRTRVMRAFEPVCQIEDVRCSCHEYRMLASGQADFLRSAKLNPWDHAAGILILQEAGGWAEVDGGENYTPNLHKGSVIAASCREVGNRVRELSTCLL